MTKSVPVSKSRVNSTLPSSAKPLNLLNALASLLLPANSTCESQLYGWRKSNSNN